MRKLVFSILLSILAININAQKAVNSIDTNHPPGGRLYYFMQTRGSDFCNEDSVLAMDCGTGFIYVTYNNNAIYSTYCLGSDGDTTDFYLGTSSFNGDTINCIFNKVYSFYSPTEYPPPKAIDSNSGSIDNIQYFKIQLLKLNCTSFKEYNLQYHYDNYVVWLPPEDEKADFEKRMRQLHKLSEFLK